MEAYAGSTEPEALRREIFNERRRELFGEGQYYFDIVRNGYYREMLRGKFKTLTDERSATVHSIPGLAPTLLKRIH